MCFKWFLSILFRFYMFFLNIKKNLLCYQFNALIRFIKYTLSQRVKKCN